MTENAVYVQFDPHAAANEADAFRIVQELVAECGKPAWALVQSFPRISFAAWDGALPDFGQVFSGRIFGPQAEVRWTREGSDWRIWRVRETETGPAAYRRRSCRYYLWGIAKGGEFTDDRIPGVPAYPMRTAPRDGDRAFVEVIEYARIWTDAANPHELEEQLNQPRLTAHRFLRLDSGHDPAAWEGEDK